MNQIAEDYTNSNLPHVQLAERMRKRDASSVTSVGDQVAYVVIKGLKDVKLHERAGNGLFLFFYSLFFFHFLWFSFSCF